MTKSNVHDKPTTSEANCKKSGNVKSAKGIGDQQARHEQRAHNKVFQVKPTAHLKTVFDKEIDHHRDLLA